MLGLILDALALGVIIAAMEHDEFPGVVRTLMCAFAMSLVMWGATLAFPGWWALLGYVLAAVVGAFVISALCGMSVKRGGIAAAIFLGYKIAMALFCLGLLAGAGGLSQQSP